MNAKRAKSNIQQLVLNPQTEKIKKEVNTIKKSFENLQNKVKISLKNRKVPPDEVAAYASGKLEPKKRHYCLEPLLYNTEHGFMLLQGHWSFLDYSLLTSIVSEYGTEDDKINLNKYNCELEAFWHRRTEVDKEEIKEFQSCFPLYSDEQIIRKHEIMIVTIEIQDRELKLLFHKVSALKKTLCRILKLEPTSIKLQDIHYHYDKRDKVKKNDGHWVVPVEVIFLVSKSLYDQCMSLQPLIKTQYIDFMAASVASLSVKEFNIVIEVSI